MKKRLMILVLCCMFFVLSLSVFAAEDCNGDLSIEEGAEEYVLTPEELLWPGYSKTDNPFFERYF